MGNIGPMELGVVLVLALLVFGPKKLPEIGKGVGQAIREFKRASRDIMSSFHDEMDDRPRPAPVTDTYASAPVGAEPVDTMPTSAPPPPTDHPSADHPSADHPSTEGSATSEPAPVAAATPGLPSPAAGSSPAQPGSDSAHAPERTT